MDKKLISALVSLSIWLGWTAIIKPAIFGFKSSQKSQDYQFLKTEHFNIMYPKSLNELAKTTNDKIENELKEYEEFFGIPINKKIIITF